MLRSLNSNTGKLIPFIIRRERFRGIVWLLCLVGTTVGVAGAFVGMFANVAEQQAMVPTMENPAMIAMCGPVYGAADYTIGAMMANEMLLFTIMAAVIMNIFFVSRYTRSDEESGRIEMIRALPVGRLSNLNSTIIVAIIMNGLLAVLTGVCLYALGIESIDLEGSMLYGAAIGVSGLLFAAITALFAQLCTTSRGAAGYSVVVFGALYLLRAAGDIDNETLARISPLGLILRTQVYVKNYWWPVLAVLLITVVVTIIAYYLNHVRDMGQGLIPARPGRRKASATLGSSLGLGWRLLRSSIIAWAIGIFVLGAAYGSIMGDLESFLKSNETFQMLIPEAAGYSLTELFMTTIMSVMAMICAAPCLIMMLKLGGEEKHGRLEHLLARAVSRQGLMGSYLAIALAVSVVMYAMSVLGLWSASSAVMDDPISLGTYMKAQMVYLPAGWVLIGLAAFLTGLSKGSGFTWLYLAYSFFAVYLGELVGMPDWSKEITPYGNTPMYPVDHVNLGTLGIITAIAVLLMAVGMILYRRRDLHS